MKVFFGGGPSSLARALCVVWFFQWHRLNEFDNLGCVDAFAARILVPPVAEVDVGTVSLLLLVPLPRAQDLVPGASKLFWPRC